MYDREKHDAEVEERRKASARRGRRKERRELAGVVALYLCLPLFLMGLIAGVQWGWKAHQCEAACDLREQPHEYLFGQGCYCQDSEGWYNPNDER